jgi:hypothetical protein
MGPRKREGRKCNCGIRIYKYLRRFAVGGVVPIRGERGEYRVFLLFVVLERNKSVIMGQLRERGREESVIVGFEYINTSDVLPWEELCP